jgi:uncharacterized protein
MSEDAGLHEPREVVGPEGQDLHRALRSIQEELEAVDWYDQRARATTDDELRAVLQHNRDEEKEHAAMVIEWLRRRDDVFDGHLRGYLFTDGSIVGIEAEDSSGCDGAAPHGAGGHATGLGLGSLRDEVRP